MSPIERSHVFNSGVSRVLSSELTSSEEKIKKTSEPDLMLNTKEIKEKKEEIEKIEELQERSLRPKNFEEYIGQEKLKRILEIGIKAAQKRNQTSDFGHIMLYGSPGLGKTSCAYLLAESLGSKAHILSAPALEKPKDIVGILLCVSEGDVVFIDEIHRLNRITEELLYPVLEDFCIDLSTGRGNTTRINRIKLPKFIMIGATTKLGNISAPLRDRFTQIYKMEFYTEQEAALIALRSSSILNYKLTEKGAKLIAKRSRGTPRIINRLCRLVRDYLFYLDLDEADEKLIGEALNIHGIDEHGLDETDRKIINTIIKNYKGGPVGLETLSMSVCEDPRTIEDFYEPFLVQAGFIERTPKGRRVTEKAILLFP